MVDLHLVLAWVSWVPCIWGATDERNARLLMEHLEPWFVHYQVNLVLSGHQHAYVRTHPLQGTRVVPQGPVHLTVGSGGKSHSQGPLQEIPEAWVAYRDHTEYGFGELYAVNATHALWSRRLHETRPMAWDDQVWLENYALLGAATKTPTTTTSSK